MDENRFLLELKTQLEQYYTGREALLKKKESLDKELSQLDRVIERVELLVEAERERLGEIVLVPLRIKVSPGMFSSMKLSKALEILLRQGSGSLRQLGEHLRKGGFRFVENKNPHRQIHFSLIKVNWAKRREDGVWEYKEV